MSLTMAAPAAAPRHAGPFTGEVVVRQLEDDPGFTKWELVERLSYRGRWDEWTVPPHFRTDFASVPRIVTWLIPRYGRFTKAAIIHDYLCAVEVRRGTISRADADGVFRRALRELGVAFLRRWLMWAAVRLDAARDDLGTLLRPRPRALLVWLVVAVPGLLFAAAPAVLILGALGLFYLAEWIALGALKLGPRLRGGRRVKAINAPKFPWTV
jgi:Protein of unknown function (DUF1353)